jgi:hypothetical protein
MPRHRKQGWSAERRGIWATVAPAVLAAVLAVPLAAWAAETDRGSLNLWPVYDQRDDPVARAHTRSGLGPFLAHERSPDGSTEEFALRPVFRWREDKTAQRLEWEVLYPLLAYSRTEQDREFQFLQLLTFREEGSQPRERESRFDLFPFYLSGETGTGERYRALWPVGGRAVDRLGLDEIEFALFPLYARFVRKQVDTRYVLWPLVSWTRGEGHSGFRIVPLYGQEVKAGVFERRFVLWPLFLQQRAGLDGDRPEETHWLLPLFVAQRSRGRDSTTVLWPFFTYAHDRDRRYEQWDFPWPLVKIARGEGRRIDRLLPLFSIERRDLRNEFLLREMISTDLHLLFPLYSRSREQIPGSLKVRDRILWWLYSDTRETGRDGTARRVDVWPLLRYQRDREGAVAFQSLALLEAFMPGNERIEASYSPLWALVSYRRNPEGDAATSILWNLLRHEETREGVAVEVLGPLLSYRERRGASHLAVLGGLLEYEERQGTRTVRLFGNRAITWVETPQPVAVLDPRGGIR